MGFFQNLFATIKYKDSDQWCNIAEINDTDMKITIYRLAETNSIRIEMFDKDPLTNNLVERDTFISYGNPKYNYMPGFATDFECEGCESDETSLDELIKENE